MTQDCDVVIFRAEVSGPHKGEVTAVFPELPGTNDPQTFQIYAHMGQHGTGNFAWYQATRPATEDEYRDLKRELEMIGYVLKVRNKMNANYDSKRYQALRKVS